MLVGRTLVVVVVLVAVPFPLLDVDDVLSSPTITVRGCDEVDLVEPLVALASPVLAVLPDIVPVAIGVPEIPDNDRVGVRSAEARSDPVSVITDGED